jgi:hypothetical protein
MFGTTAALNAVRILLVEPQRAESGPGIKLVNEGHCFELDHAAGGMPPGALGRVNARANDSHSRSRGSGCRPVGVSGRHGTTRASLRSKLWHKIVSRRACRAAAQASSLA